MSIFKKTIKFIFPSKLLILIKNNLSFLEWLIKNKPTPPPHIIKQKAIKKYAEKYNIKTLIETGTYRGKMVNAMRNVFDKIYSIELDTILYEKAVNKFEGYESIKIINGDSGEKLSEILETVNEPCIFWLDGHYSGDITAKGDLNTPIFKELISIFNHPTKNHIILIDDARCFVGKNDYPTIEKLQSFIKTKNDNLKLTTKNDIIKILC
ncbi:MAG: hypothetical protein KAS02_00490 [Candidatus Pacebacteria bacterium]|nr:hypothetical protein [Candidatus Paceibacterota bacterium]